MFLRDDPAQGESSRQMIRGIAESGFFSLASLKYALAF
jgi:hypothetical protein